MKRIETSTLVSRVRFDLRHALMVGLLLLSNTISQSTAYAHDSLYNYVEFHLLDDGSLEVTFSVHAAEIAESPAADPASTDTSWYSALSASEKAALYLRANRFLEDAYLLSTEESDPRAALPLPAVSQTDSLEKGARPGCLLAILRFEDCPPSLSLTYRTKDKRLLLVVTRSGTFPKVHDIAPGGSLTLPLNPS